VALVLNLKGWCMSTGKLSYGDLNSQLTLGNNHLITLNQAKKWGENSATKLSSSGFNENNMLKSHQIEKRKNSFSSFGV
jgi:hypothetical protein